LSPRKDVADLPGAGAVCAAAVLGADEWGALHEIDRFFREEHRIIIPITVRDTGRGDCPEAGLAP
jgi:hypothetical protein